MARGGLFLLFLAAFSLAASCRDPRLRSATVGGDAIRGSVFRARKPVRLRIELYSADSLLRTASTDKQGGFDFSHLSPGAYLLSFGEWGKSTVDVVAQPKGGQIFSDSLMVSISGEEVCVATVSVTN
jgi:hypothetical protein